MRYAGVPPSRLRSVGPPRLNAATPGGGLLRCLNPRLGLLFAAQDHLCHERRTICAKKALDNKPPAGAAASSRGGPAERKREGGTLQNTNAPLGNVPERKREGGTLQNTNAFSCNLSWGTFAQHKCPAQNVPLLVMLQMWPPPGAASHADAPLFAGNVPLQG